jgi:predicted transposase/invertase (TIGR01784 family)
VQQGQDKAKEEIARNLLRKGMTLEFVAETTELSIERVKEIVKEIIS